MRMLRKVGLILCLIAVLVSAEKGCPYKEEIEPCTCKQSTVSDHDVNIQCINIYDTEKLLQVFENAKRFHFLRFSLVRSTLQYIPHAIFDDVEVKYFEIFEVTLRNMFDEVPTDPGLTQLIASEVTVFGGWDWKKLAVFKNLVFLMMADVRLKLSADFRSNVSKKLNFLYFKGCSIKKLQDDEFADLDDLSQFTLSEDSIKVIKRTMFPRKTKLIEFSMVSNKISTIPNDMFSDMPDLRMVNLMDNLISVLPEAAFPPNNFNMNVTDNPIKCDCLLAWVLDRNNTRGKCYAPKAIHDKDFKTLTRDDIRC